MRGEEERNGASFIMGITNPLSNHINCHKKKKAMLCYFLAAIICGLIPAVGPFLLNF